MAFVCRVLVILEVDIALNQAILPGGLRSILMPQRSVFESKREPHLILSPRKKRRM
jgi:hypothetical protein